MLLENSSIKKIHFGNKQEWENKDEIKQEKLLLTGFESNNLTPVGYDLTIGNWYAILKKNIKGFKNLEERKAKSIKVRPGKIVAIETAEYVGMPQNKLYSGIICSKVSVAERGFSHISTTLA